MEIFFGGYLRVSYLEFCSYGKLSLAKLYKTSWAESKISCASCSNLGQSAS
jgi:hypothetical protein